MIEEKRKQRATHGFFGAWSTDIRSVYCLYMVMPAEDIKRAIALLERPRRQTLAPGR